MFRRKKFLLRLPSRTLVLGERTLIMGVLNVTPDSFSDGGRFLDPQKAINHALEMESAGADILDIGGESTRPGSEGISAEEELARVVPVLEGLRGRLKIPVSIDTPKASVAEAAVKLGAEILNDVTALRNGPMLAEIARRHDRGPRVQKFQPDDLGFHLRRLAREWRARAHGCGCAQRREQISPSHFILLAATNSFAQ